MDHDSELDLFGEAEGREIEITGDVLAWEADHWLNTANNYPGPGWQGQPTWHEPFRPVVSESGDVILDGCDDDSRVTDQDRETIRNPADNDQQGEPEPFEANPLDDEFREISQGFVNPPEWDRSEVDAVYGVRAATMMGE